MPKEFIEIDPIEELLKGIGIVHGKAYENELRYLVCRIQEYEYKMWLKQFQNCDIND